MGTLLPNYFEIGPVVSDKKMFFLVVAMATMTCHGFQISSNVQSGLTKDQYCKIWYKLVYGLGGHVVADTFWGGGPGVGLTLFCIVVYSSRRFVLCLTLCHFILVFFSPFSIAITSLGEERANLSAFRAFVRFVLVWICRFPLPLGVWEGLRFVIVALPGLFSYLFFFFFYFKVIVD